MGVTPSLTLTGARVFDGIGFSQGPLHVTQGKIGGPGGETTSLDGGILAPGFVDLQVNGGGGVMFCDFPCLESLRLMTRAHLRLGATAILPTLISAPRADVALAIEAVKQAISEGLPGIAGLHLEGPHLALPKKGAHDAAHIRPMQEEDLAMLCAAARDLPFLMVTLAPEAVSMDQIRVLAAAGAFVSLGHSDCSAGTAMTAREAGASCVTHLFNAMSQMSARAPGLAGMALARCDVMAGLICDLIHVDPLTVQVALAARSEGLFLVSDAMAVAGTRHEGFSLNGREVSRRDGRLVLADGTLAGADLDLTQALRNLVSLDVPPERALAMATSIPGKLIGAGHLHQGAPADMIWLDDKLHLRRVWRAGKEVI